ncbi:MAG: (2Fe-2S)-binding protein [Nannocystaceae bacterium]|nr:(2Fe-2S)-binding protein [Nannocystaceae bacterium]
MSESPAQSYLRLSVNGVAREVSVHPMTRLIDVLREDVALTGTKEGCGEGECGACSVFIDGVVVNSCLVPVAQVVGTENVTVEGLADGDTLHPVQQAFIAAGGAQCGICTPGMLIAAVALLRDNDEPTEDEIRVALAGNLCRCTGYGRIVQSVVDAATLVRATKGAGA